MTPRSLPQILAVLLSFASALQAAAPVFDIGTRRELLVDDSLLETLDGVALRMHKPEPRDVALVCDAPWEGNVSAYFTLLQDGDRFRCYYRGSHYDETAKKSAHAATTCYAESRDGIVWNKPKLGLFAFGGSTDNNIVHLGAGTHNFSPFLDTRPDCATDARYKALAGALDEEGGSGGGKKKKPALQAYRSPDGLRWTLLREAPVITDGAFDSQNTAFFDPLLGKYRAYWRYFTPAGKDERGKKTGGLRAIRTAVSADFLHWEEQADLVYGDAPQEHLYTNAVRPYARAPHLLIGFPTRYMPKHQQVEPVLMTSRDGVHFRRWAEPLIPITAPKDRDGNRSNYLAIGMLELPGDPRHLSVYATEAYYRGPGSRLRRFVFRLDGFVSASAEKGELLTKPLRFDGTRLLLNIVSRGRTRAELLDSEGRPVPGFALADCAPIVGDAIDRAVAWKGGRLDRLAGKPVRLRVVLEQADLYAFQFAR